MLNGSGNRLKNVSGESSDAGSSVAQLAVPLRIDQPVDPLRGSRVLSRVNVIRDTTKTIYRADLHSLVPHGKQEPHRAQFRVRGAKQEPSWASIILTV
jgi:hypothetical protein